jgi:hypothetical protein
MALQPDGVKTPGHGGFVFGSLARVAILAAAAVLLLVGFCYSPVLGFEYVWDDRAFFFTSTDLRVGDFIKAITAPVMATAAYFRPLVMASFAIELRLAGGQPMWSHLGNLLLHLANTAMVGLLAWKLRSALASGSATRAAAVVIAMLAYGLHPALIEAVAWVSGRFDLMVAFFSLVALLCASAHSRIAALSAGLAFFAAALSKEMAATVPAIVFLLLWALRHPELPLREVVPRSLCGRDRWLYLALVGAGLLYLAIRMQYMRQLAHSDDALREQLDSALVHLGFVGATLAFYLKTIVWPFKDLGPLHPIDVPAMTTTEVVAGGGFVVLCAAFIAFSVWRPGRVRLLLSALLISLLPVANIIPLRIIGNVGHERFLVFPLAIAVLALVSLDTSRWQLSALMRRRLPLLVGAMTVLWVGIAVLNLRVTLPLWRSDLALWTWAYSAHPEAAIAQFSLASAALQANRNDVAQRVIEEAEKRGPLPLRLSVPYGQFLIRTGKAREGIAKIEEALQSEPQPHLLVEQKGVSLDDAQINRQSFASWLLVYAYSNLAEGRINLRQFKQAQRDAEIAAFYQRDNPVPHLYRAMAIYGQDKWEEGDAAYRRARQMYVPAVQYEADEVRLSFFRQLCARAAEAPNVCRQVGTAPARAASSAHR